LRPRDSGRGACESDEERIALCVYFNAAVARERFSKHAPMLGQHIRVLVPDLLQKPRRPLNVGEEQGDRSRRERPRQAISLFPTIRAHQGTPHSPDGRVVYGLTSTSELLTELDFFN
jgi:hypothetical protein